MLGQTVIVVNKPGAQGAIAADYVARQPADGYTLMLGYIGTHGINPALQKLNYDPVRDFTAIGMVADSPTLMVVSSSIGVQDVPGLLKYGPVSYTHLDVYKRQPAGCRRTGASRPAPPRSRAAAGC